MFDYVQKWEVKSVQLCQPGKVDQAALRSIIITDESHAHRSAEAEEVTRLAEQECPLPPEAAGGGKMDADPYSKAETKLTKSALLAKYVSDPQF